jgi:hypothetical protein
MEAQVSAWQRAVVAAGGNYREALKLANPPAYFVVRKDPDGRPELVTDANGAPMRWSPNISAALDVNEAAFNQRVDFKRRYRAATSSLDPAGRPLPVLRP